MISYIGNFKCVICGKDFVGYSKNAKYCSRKCAKLIEFNYNNNTNFKTLEELEEYKNSDSYRGKINAKPVMQFRLDGSYIRTIPSTFICDNLGDENGSFTRNSVSRCARGERNTYRGYIWIYKEDYSPELLEHRLNLVKNRFNSIKKPIVCLDEEGNILGRYDSISEGAEASFVDRISLIKHLKRKKKHNKCIGYVWMYEDDYTYKNGAC